MDNSPSRAWTLGPTVWRPNEEVKDDKHSYHMERWKQEQNASRRGETHSM